MTVRYDLPVTGPRTAAAILATRAAGTSIGLDGMPAAVALAIQQDYFGSRAELMAAVELLVETMLANTPAILEGTQ